MTKSKIMLRYAKKHGIRVKKLKLRRLKPSDLLGTPILSNQEVLAMANNDERAELCARVLADPISAAAWLHAQNKKPLLESPFDTEIDVDQWLHWARYGHSPLWFWSI